MKKIANWTFGAFFRSIGRTLAFIFLGLILAWVIAKFNIKLPFLTVKAYNVYFEGNDINIDLPDSKEYFVVGHTTGNLAQGGISYYSSDESFYFVCNYNYKNQNTYMTCVARNYKIEVSQDVFNSSQEYKYYDYNNNKYYIFTSSEDIDSYSMYPNTSTTWHSGVINKSDSLKSTPNITTYKYDWRGCTEDSITCGVVTPPYNVIEYNVTFHLNNGKACYATGGGSSGGGSSGILCHYFDFTQKFYDKRQLYDYILKNTVTKTGEDFVGWYSDINLINLYDFGNDLLRDIDIYAKFVFSNAEKLISEINFNEYTFPNDKNFAIINNTNYLDTYLGFGYDFNNISVFKYNITAQKFEIYPEYKIFSMGKIDNYYYYHTPLSAYQTEVKYIILDKNQLKAINSSGQTEEYYTFKVSENATVTFYADLTNVTISDSNGNNYTGDLSGVYWNNYNTINSNSDIVGIFRNIYSNENSNIFSYFSQLWYKFKSTPIFNYFYLIIIGSFIVFILKVASRK